MGDNKELLKPTLQPLSQDIPASSSSSKNPTNEEDSPTFKNTDTEFAYNNKKHSRPPLHPNSPSKMPKLCSSFSKHPPKTPSKQDIHNIRNLVQEAFFAIDSGNHLTGLSLIQGLCGKYAVLHRVHAGIARICASRTENHIVKDAYLRTAIEAARTSLDCAPNSVEYTLNSTSSLGFESYASIFSKGALLYCHGLRLVRLAVDIDCKGWDLPSSDDSHSLEDDVIRSNTIIVASKFPPPPSRAMGIVHAWIQEGISARNKLSWKLENLPMLMVIKIIYNWVQIFIFYKKVRRDLKPIVGSVSLARLAQRAQELIDKERYEVGVLIIGCEYNKYQIYCAMMDYERSERVEFFKAIGCGVRHIEDDLDFTSTMSNGEICKNVVKAVNLAILRSDRCGGPRHFLVLCQKHPIGPKILKDDEHLYGLEQAT